MEKNSQESQGFYKLSWLQRIGFGSGDLAQNLIFQTHVCTCCSSIPISMDSMQLTFP